MKLRLHLLFFTNLFFVLSLWSQKGITVDYADSVTDTFEDYLEKTSAKGETPFPEDLRTESVFRVMSAPIGFTLVCDETETSYAYNSNALKADIIVDEGISFESSLKSNVVFMNLSENRMLTRFHSKSEKKILRLDAAIPKIEWQIGTQTKVICGFVCTEATGYFCGDTLTAYFTTALPFSSGPYMFSGLPGLILQVYYQENKRCITAQNVMLDNSKLPAKVKSKQSSSYCSPPKD